MKLLTFRPSLVIFAIGKIWKHSGIAILALTGCITLCPTPTQAGATGGERGANSDRTDQLTNQKDSSGSELKIGDHLPPVTLTGEDGGKLDNSPWTPAEHGGKVHMIFYVDPDERADGEELEGALKKEEFPSDKVGSSAIINMKAAAMPNFLIGMSLSSKQKKYPRTSYAKDFSKFMVRKWGLKDDAYNFLVAGPTGKLLYRLTGKPTQEDIKKIIEIIKANLPAVTK